MLILGAEMQLLRFMAQTVRLRLRPRGWLAHQDPLHQRWTDNLINYLQMPCEHPAWMLARSVNRHGQFQKCCQCATRWKSVLGGWEELPSSPSRRPLPPSHSSGARREWANRLLPGMDVQSSTATSSGSRPVTGLKAKVKPQPRPRGELDFMEAEVRSMRLGVGAPRGR